MKLGKRGPTIAAAAGMAVAFVLSRRPYDYTTYPWKFPVFFLGAFFLYVGSRLREFADKYEETDRKLTTASAAALAASLGLELISENAVGMNENEYANLLFFAYLDIRFLFPDSSESGTVPFRQLQTVDMAGSKHAVYRGL